MKNIALNIRDFFLDDKLLLAATIAAIVTSFFNRPHLSYVNFHVIVSVFCIMTLVQVYQRLHVLDYFARELIIKSHSKRALMQMLLALTFVGAMFLTNDMTVLTFVPLFILIARQLDFSPILPVTLITISANLGSSLTPFGSPHNIFLVSFYHMTIRHFFEYSIPILIVSIIMLTATTFLFPKEPIKLHGLHPVEVEKGPLWYFVPLTIVVFLAVFSLIPLWVTPILVIIAILVFDPKLFKTVDYGLLLTFFCFFIAVGNLSHIPTIATFMRSLVGTAKQTYLTGLISCQLIANVPTEILLSSFTNHSHAMFLAINIGGVGTMFASLANLIAYKRFKKGWGKDIGKFLVVFTGMNFLFLIILGTFGYFLI
ncbi:SLC13 family permease [Latilactobacillus sakei]|uniref:SLC13 family permease n=1 Tax=Latilactobacillus sakei TaxID=1599 RepID=UPI000C1292D8|nr:SLC13 family permease [Latilactobacillus sakei]MCP8854928.1 sodium:cation symporter [Latilactobacillus sakei]RXA80032.1 sodium:cation symporter [Latilactobacillus sakei]UNC22230.1 sodium:cation symporter [Latilactobacillus sakei]UNC24040.1 sodium:cation symporter [Latilactobacillus sakei]USG07343.1 sodium:cation symporter [Latilactobacillus sakei]